MGTADAPDEARPVHPYDVGRPARRRVRPGNRLRSTLTTVLVVVLGAAALWTWIYLSSSDLADAEGEPARWEDRAERQVTRVEGDCVTATGRYTPDETRCPATWDGSGDDAWVSDLFGSTVPDVGGTVTARVTYTDDGRRVATTDLRGGLADRYRDPAQAAWDPLIAFALVGVLFVPVFWLILRSNRRRGRREGTTGRPPPAASSR